MNKNYKLSCVGVDSKGEMGRMIFHVYAVKGIENAERIVRKNSYRRSLMRKHDLSWRTVEFNIVETDGRGETLPEFVGAEKEIRVREAEQIIQKKKSFDRKARDEYWKSLGESK